MMGFFKKYFTEEKNVGIFQSIMLILFLLIFFLILFFIFSKPRNYYEKISSLPLEKEKTKKKL
ncbi:cytochrome oxidase [Blattabacterium cuenoti]|uniref:cytochrome oxidase n=1 Tax=Blattabacterium cuenoti TaxID=1653831 RepID=UPI00163CC231|nr:cytochrome oxidase [Blattabacterium cuenoti]